MDYMYIFSKHDKWKRVDEFIFETYCYTDKSERLSLHKEHIFNIEIYLCLLHYVQSWVLYGIAYIY